MGATNICPWLKVNSLETCGKNCVYEYCDTHRQQLRMGRKPPVPCKYCGVGTGSKLKKDDLIKVIAEVHAAEFIKRLQRAQKTGRHSALLGDVEDPHKKGRRGRELGQVMEEVDAALRAKRYISAVEKKPLLRQQPLKQITDRLHKPRGPARSKVETLARAIKREAPKILENFLDPGAYYGLVVDNAPVLFPDGSYVKKGDTIVRREIREDVDGRSYKLRPVARGPDITGDGELYWASFENGDLRASWRLNSWIRTRNTSSSRLWERLRSP
ncbi:hypothetical protein RRG08_051502 [Elysia crispata]|uniref:Uncharacterized protein n=1 Tax=Elysia crispata TaxID=231223 RepID=A0AAE1DAJ2_9GAST|nr:hypothetical protein RRG08_051502 [Elysia crispata]